MKVKASEVAKELSIDITKLRELAKEIEIEFKDELTLFERDKIIDYKEKSLRYIIDSRELNHMGFIEAMITTDKYLITGSNDHSIKIYSIDDFSLIYTIKAHKSNITSLININDNLFASGDTNGNIKIFDKSSFREINSIKTDNWINSLVNLNDNLFASGDSSGNIKIFDKSSFREINSIKTDSSIRTLINLNDNLFAFCYRNGEIKIFDKSNLKEINSIKTNIGIDFLINLNNNLFVSCYKDEIKIFDKESFKEIKSIKTKSWITSLINLNDNLFAFCYRNGEIKIFDKSNLKEINSIKTDSWINPSINLNDNLFAFASDKGEIKIFDKESFKEIKSIEAGREFDSSIHINDNLFAFASNKGEIKIFDKENFKEVNSIKINDGIDSLINLNDDFFAFASNKGEIKLFDKENFKEVNSIKINDGIDSLINLNDKLFASNDKNGEIKIFDKENFKEIKSIETKSRINSLINLNDKLFASNDKSGEIKICERKSFKEINSIKNNGWIDFLINLNENFFASGFDNGEIKIFDKENFREINSINLKLAVFSFKVLNDTKFLIGFRNGDIYEIDILDITNIKFKSIIETFGSVNNIEVFDGKCLYSTESGDLAYFDLESESKKHVAQKTKLKLYPKGILLGDSEVGKTTFAYWLKYSKFNDKIKSTDGMRIFDIELGEVEVNLNAKAYNLPTILNLWDFGGQSEYQLSHQQNYKHTSLIFLCVDVNQNIEESYFWIDRIKQHIDELHKSCKIYIIGTKSKDSNPKILRDLKEYIQKLIDKNIEIKLANLDSKRDEFLKEIGDSFRDFDYEIDENALSTTNEQDEVLNRIDKEVFIKSYDLDKNVIEFFSKLGKIEKIDNYILLRAYWKSIFAKSILRYARENEIVVGSISLRDLVNQKFKVEFDESFEDEKSDNFIEDRELLNSVIANRDFFMGFLKELTLNFLNKSICYFKHNMLVFPSRFNQKSKIYDKRILKHKHTISLQIVNNIEESIGIIITKLFYTQNYKLKKHLFDAVELIDSENSSYFIYFDRKDFRKDIKQSKKNQNIVTFDIVGDDERGLSELIKLIKAIMKKHLIPFSENRKFKVEKNDLKVGSGEIEVRESEFKNFRDFLVKKSQESGYEINLIDDDLTKYSRDLLEIEDEVKKDIESINKKIDNYFKEKDTPKINYKILHLSDLHFEENTNYENEFILLKCDFEHINANKIEKFIENIKNDEEDKDEEDKIDIANIDYIVISGDITKSAKREEFLKFQKFLTKLIKLCDISAEEVIVVTGNHDYSRKHTHESYFIADDKNFNEKLDFRINEKIYLKRDEEKWKQKFQNFSDYLYEYLYHKEFKNNQIEVFNKDKDVFFTLINTSSKIDHFNTNKAYFDNALLINKSKEFESCKNKKVGILVGHHGLDLIADSNFLKILQKFNFFFYLHGHLHKDISINYASPQSKHLEPILIIGAGSFSVDTSHLWDGIPFRYNILDLSIENKNIKECIKKDGKCIEESKQKKLLNLKVYTREREPNNPNWKGAYIYTDKNGDNIDYWEEEIILSK